MVDVVSLRYGTIFKKAFSDPEVFSGFASDVLGIPIRVDKVQQEFRYPDAVGHVDVTYDLFAEDVSHRVIVEIQHLRAPDFFDRFLHYHAASIVEQAQEGRGYRATRTVYTLVVLTTEPREERLRFAMAVSDVDPVNEQGKRLGVYKHRLVFLCPKLVNAEIPPGARRWMELVADSLDEQVDEASYSDPLLQRVIGAIRRSTLSPRAWEQLKNEQSLEDTMREDREEAEQKGARKGKLAARREVLVMQAQQVGLSLGEAELARIEACEDLATLDRWLSRVHQVKSAGELFG